MYSRLRCTLGSIPHIYSLPKISKLGTSPPIVSFCTSPTHSLLEHLMNILSFLLGTTFSTVLNSGDSISFVCSLALSDKVLVLKKYKIKVSYHNQHTSTSFINLPWAYSASATTQPLTNIPSSTHLYIPCLMGGGLHRWWKIKALVGVCEVAGHSDDDKYHPLLHTPFL